MFAAQHQDYRFAARIKQRSR